MPAISTLEKTTPVRKSTLSRLMFFSKSCLPTSGLNWSSLISTSAGSPPSLPPFIFTASMNASRMSTPRLADGPDKVLMKPTLTAVGRRGRHDRADCAGQR